MTAQDQDEESEIAEPQSSVVIDLPAVKTISKANSQQIAYKINVILGLAIAELVLGFVCMVVGALCFVIRTICVGEGIWCGIWIAVTGALGVAIRATNEPLRCLINTHIAFSLVGAVFSAILFVLSVTFMTCSFASLMFHSLQNFFALSSFALLIASASVSCCLDGCCRNGKSNSAEFGTVWKPKYNFQGVFMPAVPRVDLDCSQAAIPPVQMILGSNVQDLQHQKQDHLSSQSQTNKSNEPLVIENDFQTKEL